VFGYTNSGPALSGTTPQESEPGGSGSLVTTTAPGAHGEMVGEDTGCTTDKACQIGNQDPDKPAGNACLQSPTLLPCSRGQGEGSAASR
jgi:hypothetical protein